MALVTNKQFGVIVVGAAIGALVMKDKVKTLFTETLNPASTNNAAYGTVNHVGSAATGNEYFSLGTWVYNKTHPEEEQF